MKRYEAYKDSGVDWIGEIPEGWFQEPFSSVFSLKSIINNKNEELLSVYLDKGVIRFSDVGEKRTNVTSEDLSKYQLVEEGDFVLNNQQAWRGSVGVSFNRGIVSPAYIVLAVKNNFDFRFLNYLLRNRSFVTHYLLCSKGVGTIQRNLYWPQLKRVYLIFPSLEQQQTIAQFLDDKTAKIDQTITIKQKEIELLKERRQILIQQAVTGKWSMVNGQWLKTQTEKLKPSGVDWIGEIPEHWEVRKLKYVVYMQSGETITAESFTDEGYSVMGGNGFRGYTNRYTNDGNFILIGRQGALCGNVNYAQGKFFATEHAIVVYPNKDVLDILWLGEVIKLADLNNLSQTAAQPGISVTQIKNVIIPFIPQSEQLQIVEYLKKIEEKISKATLLKQQEIEKLKEYKTVLIDNVVTGKVKINL